MRSQLWTHTYVILQRFGMGCRIGWMPDHGQACARAFSVLRRLADCPAGKLLKLSGRASHKDTSTRSWMKEREQIQTRTRIKTSYNLAGSHTHRTEFHTCFVFESDLVSTKHTKPSLLGTRQKPRAAPHAMYLRRCSHGVVTSFFKMRRPTHKQTRRNGSSTRFRSRVW